MKTDPFRAAEQATESAAAIADWLATVFVAPLTAESVVACRSTEGDFLLGAIGQELDSMDGIGRMRLALSTGTTAEATRRLSTAYMLLYEGPGGPDTVALCESAYGTNCSRLFQQPTADIEALLREVDLGIAQRFREPADHLSIQLSLLARLLRTGRSRQAEGLRERMSIWTPCFAAACIQFDRTGFYGGAGAVFQQLLKTVAIQRADFLSRPEPEKVL